MMGDDLEIDLKVLERLLAQAHAGKIELVITSGNIQTAWEPTSLVRTYKMAPMHYSGTITIEWQTLDKMLE